MKNLQIKVRQKEDDICYYPEDFDKIKFLGFETHKGLRYFRVNWASTENRFAFWYPFVGGDNISVYTTAISAGDVTRLLANGARFYSFENANEIYQWMADGV